MAFLIPPPFGADLPFDLRGATVGEVVQCARQASIPECVPGQASVFWAAVLHKGILREAFVLRQCNGNPLRRVDQDHQRQDFHDQDHYKHHNITRRGTGKTMIKTTSIIPIPES